jgi:hypothetical protein
LFPVGRHKILVSGTVTPQLVAIDGPLNGATYATRQNVDCAVALYFAQSSEVVE